MASWPLDLQLLEHTEKKYPRENRVIDPSKLIQSKDDLGPHTAGMTVYQSIKQSKKCEICDSNPAFASVIYDSKI